MVEGGTFKGTAATEMKQELDLEIPEEKLINLTKLAIPEKKVEELGEITPRAIFPSAGGCNEYIQIVLHEIAVPRAQLKEWTGKLIGLRDERKKVNNFIYSCALLFRIGLPYLSCTPLT
jgi:ADP-sugar diphosphatase